MPPRARSAGHDIDEFQYTLAPSMLAQYQKAQEHVEDFIVQLEVAVSGKLDIEKIDKVLSEELGKRHPNRHSTSTDLFMSFYRAVFAKIPNTKPFNQSAANLRTTFGIASHTSPKNELRRFVPEGTIMEKIQNTISRLVGEANGRRKTLLEQKPGSTTPTMRSEIQALESVVVQLSTFRFIWSFSNYKPIDGFDFDTLDKLEIETVIKAVDPIQFSDRASYGRLQAHMQVLEYLVSFVPRIVMLKRRLKERQDGAKADNQLGCWTRNLTGMACQLNDLIENGTIGEKLGIVIIANCICAGSLPA